MAGERILVVDDNRINLKLTNALLSKDGFEVQSVTNAAEALKAIGTFDPSLILVDIQMPETDGLELTRCLKANPTTNRIPVLACTAYVSEWTEQKALDAGCVGYISKPIDMSMPKVLREYIEQSQSPKP